ncbi:MAG: hypothetical protein VYD85_05280 [Pseudomonadota bacterium]|nr:hypothetical protein [Pseudomonadota bacterium]
MTVFEAAVFLYCQAQILYKARGIPAWRTHLIPLMIVASDLLEGIGPLAFMIGFPQGFPMPPGGIALIIVNSVLCCSYREGANKYAPPLARKAIAECDQDIRYGGQLAPAILFLLNILFPIIPLSIFTIAGVAIICGGAFWK